jgi:hypothetical protein
MEHVHLKRANELDREIRKLLENNTFLLNIIRDKVKRGFSVELKSGSAELTNYVMPVNEDQLCIVSEFLIKLNTDKLEVLEKEFKEL